MAGRLVVMTPEDYARWTAAQPQGDDLAHQGEALFRSLGCSGCHTATARPCTRPICTASTGTPCSSADGRMRHRRRSLSARLHLLPRQHSVAGFPPLMPNFTGSVSEGQIVELVAYIKSLTTIEQRDAGSIAMREAP